MYRRTTRALYPLRKAATPAVVGGTSGLVSVTPAQVLGAIEASRRTCAHACQGQLDVAPFGVVAVCEQDQQPRQIKRIPGATYPEGRIRVDAQRTAASGEITRTAATH